MPYNSNDNTRVNKPLIQEPIKYKLQPGEVRLPSGQIIKVKQEELSQGSSEPKILRDKRYEELTRQHEQQKQKEREAFTIQGLTAPLQLISPSHIIGSANSDKPFLESYLGDSYNSATGNIIGDFALDAVVGSGLWKGAKTAGDLIRADVRFIKSLFSDKQMYKNKINGIPKNSILGLDYTGKAIFSPDVKKGISAESKRDLMHNTVDRNIRRFKLEGYSDAKSQAYKEKANNLFDNVNVGTYSGDDYAMAGKNSTGGFFDETRNFISINRDSNFPKNFVEKHEARHLLDHNMGISYSQNKILSNAYDNDFINLPKTKYAGSLKDYPHMRAERVTTNRDAREALFNDFNPDVNFYSHQLQDEVIDGVSMHRIFKAVENSNDYGRKYIQLLRDSKKLTPEKAQQFREAMKHVGGVVAPIGIGTHLYNQNNIDN